LLPHWQLSPQPQLSPHLQFGFEHPAM